MNKINSQNFKRIEQKYILDDKQYQIICSVLKQYFSKNKYFKSTICNIYFDDINYELARISIEKPIYKQKVRARVYKDEKGNFNEVFLELKKKYQDVVFKRRVIISYKEFEDYINYSIIPKSCDSTSMGEIDYVFKRYNLIKKMYLSYDREAYFLKADESFRITIDKNLLYRENKLDFRENSFGEKITDKYVMEIKSNASYPLWFCRLLSENKIYKSSFSKYGNAYKNKLLKSK